jgi:hypothetical protein
MRLAHARSSGSETLLHIQFLAGCTIDTLESSIRKRQAAKCGKNTQASNVLLCLPGRHFSLDLVHQGMSQPPLAQFGKVFKYQGLP